MSPSVPCELQVYLRQNLLALVAASHSGLPTSATTFLPLSQCSTCVLFATMRVWFHRPV